jgi:1-acyl-sn-glycerol-3-phosphate acyltransferase
MSVPSLVPQPRWLRRSKGSLASLTRVGRRLSAVSGLLLEAGYDAALEREHGFDDPGRVARRLSWLAENLCAVHGVRVEVGGQVPTGPSVLVANHVGYLDPMVLLAQLPAVPIAKRELSAWPVVGPTIGALGVVMVRRGDPYDGARALRHAMRALEGGTNVLVFPEGTTSRGNRVLPLRRGVFGIARRLGVPVVPVVVRYAEPGSAWVDDDWFLPHYLRTLGRSTVTAHVQFCDAVQSEGAPAELARFVRARMQAALEQLVRLPLAA